MKKIFLICCAVSQLACIHSEKNLNTESVVIQSDNTVSQNVEHNIHKESTRRGKYSGEPKGDNDDDSSIKCEIKGYGRWMKKHKLLVALSVSCVFFIVYKIYTNKFLKVISTVSNDDNVQALAGVLTDTYYQAALDPQIAKHMQDLRHTIMQGQGNDRNANIKLIRQWMKMAVNGIQAVMPLSKEELAELDECAGRDTQQAQQFKMTEAEIDAKQKREEAAATKVVLAYYKSQTPTPEQKVSFAKVRADYKDAFVREVLQTDGII